MTNNTSFEDVYSASQDPTFGSTPSEELRDYILAKKLNGKALDLACGDGRDTLFLASMGFQTIGLDQSKKALEKLKNFAKCKHLDKEISTVSCDLRYWDYPVSFFDLITSSTGMDHIPREDLKRVMEQIANSLRVGGILFLEVHTIDDPGYSAMSENVSELSSFIAHYFERNELLLLVLELGFEVIRYEEKIEEDKDHGRLHYHGFANVLAKKVSI